MPVLDVFNNDAFTTLSLSGAIDKIETVPNHLGAMGIFADNPVRTEAVAIESRNGELSVIQTSQRGAPLETKAREKRTVEDFRTRRIAKHVRILASELQFIRSMGEEEAVMNVQQEIARRLSGPNGLIADVETTWENMRLGAVQGIVTDADNAVIYNYFSKFGISAPAAINFDFANKVGGDLRAFIQKEVVRKIRRNAKGANYSGIQAICGDVAFDALINNDEVRDTYLKSVQAADLRDGYDGESFRFGGVTWTNYVGTDDNSKVAVADNEVKLFPLGAAGIFETVWSPGETFADIGQLGQPLYAMVVPDTQRDTFVDLEVYSYPLHVARRPDMLLKGTG